MAREAESRSLKDALAHPIRTELIRLLRHHGEPATATELQPDLLHPATLADVSYHLLVLEGAGVIQLDERESDQTRRAYVVGGDNADEAGA